MRVFTRWKALKQTAYVQFVLFVGMIFRFSIAIHMPISPMCRHISCQYVGILIRLGTNTTFIRYNIH